MSTALDEILAWLDSRAERCRRVPEWIDGAVAYKQRAAFLRSQSQEIARLTERCDAYKGVVDAAQKMKALWDKGGVFRFEFDCTDLFAALAVALASPAGEQKDKTT